MTKTISRLYDNYTEAQRAVTDLEAAGVPHSDISIVANNSDNWYNANGKVDRKALPAPERVSTQEYEAPRSEIEAAVAAVWAEVLGVQRIGRQDHFFELGGHSLLAVRVISGVRAAFQVELPLRILFERMTVSDLAVEVLAHVIENKSKENQNELLLSDDTEEVLL